MRHKCETIEIGTHTCILHSEENANFFLIQPVDSHDTEELEQQITYIEENTQLPFVHLAIRISKWNAELTPWTAPPVFGKIPFGDGASNTLLYIKEQLLPEINSRYPLNTHKGNTLLGGYSLAGLFALWTAYQPDIPFKGIASASPSAWYTGWLDYAETHQPQVEHAYLSLGDKEERTKTKLMKTISKDILRQEQLLKEKGVNCKMEWNEGNHFQDNGVRIAKGFLWLMQQ
ncbi:alpha/beta hydrolase [Prevotella fusca]